MASGLARDQEVLDGIELLIDLRKCSEWLEKKLRHICGYLQAIYQPTARDLSVTEWRQQVRDIVEYKDDKFLRLFLSWEGTNLVKPCELTQEFVNKTRGDKWKQTTGRLEERIDERGKIGKYSTATKSKLEIHF